MAKVGIIICDRYRLCSGAKCFRSARERVGGFSRYEGEELEIVAFGTCGGCPGANIEDLPEAMKKAGAEAIHLATGFVVGYPPCPYLEDFIKLIEEKSGLPVVVGTHPVPEKYYRIHQKFNYWEKFGWEEMMKPLLPEKEIRESYD